MNSILIIALNTFREAIRNKILYSAILFACLLVGISAFYGSVTIGSQVQVIKDFGLFAISFFGAVITMLSGVSLLTKEIKQKTIYNILSKPVRRWQFVLGKYLGLTLTMSLLTTIMGLALIGFVALFEGHIDWLLFQGVFFIILELAVVSAITIFFSSLVVTTTLAGIFTFGTYIAGRSIDYFSYFYKDEGNHVLKSVIGFFDKILPHLSSVYKTEHLVYGISATNFQLVYAPIYTIAYCTLALLVSIAIFSRREFV